MFDNMYLAFWQRGKGVYDCAREFCLTEHIDEDCFRLSIRQISLKRHKLFRKRKSTLWNENLYEEK